MTDDLHANGVVGVMTGYEEKFHALGTPIHRCEILMPARRPDGETERQHVCDVSRKPETDGIK